MTITKNDILFYISLLLALWFAFMAMVWVYWAALFIGYPAGFISFLLWLRIEHEQRKRTKIIPITLIVGFVLSLTVLIALLITN